MRVTLIVKGNAPSISGLANYEKSLYANLTTLGHDVRVSGATLPAWLTSLNTLGKRYGYNLAAFAGTYPLAFPALPTTGEREIVHLTSQTLASSFGLPGLDRLFARRSQVKIVVTVHDIIPWTTRNDPVLRFYNHRVEAFFDYLAMRGLRKADRLIADSVATKQALVNTLNIQPGLIEVVPLGIDPKVFRPLAMIDPAVLARYQLSPEKRYIIYAGSDDPRKNLSILARAFALIHTIFPDVEWIKVGSSAIPEQRAELIKTLERLQIRNVVHFLEGVPEEDLVILYNLASAAVFPSLIEGFGLPALEAMACGTPVIVSEGTSLTEIVAEAGMAIDPRSATGVAQAIYTLLSKKEVASQLREAGLQRVALFNAQRSANEISAIYGKLF